MTYPTKGATMTQDVKAQHTPELLEALKHMIRIVEDYVSIGAMGVVHGQDGQPDYPLLAEYLHSARAAIARATGEQP